MPADIRSFSILQRCSFLSCLAVQVAKIGKTSTSKSNVASPFYKSPWPKALPEGTNDLPQAEARRFCPTNTHIWRDNTRGAWAFHVEGHKRFSVPWSRYGGDSREAMLEGMRMSWILWTCDRSLPSSVCPIAGLFP